MNKLMSWIIYNNDGKEIGRLSDDEADDSKDAVLNWADMFLSAKLVDISKEYKLK